MGCDKAGLLLGGRTLLDRHLALLRTLGAGKLWISRMDTHIPPGVEGILPDREPDRGPMEGIARGLGATASAHLLVMAVDLPFLDERWGRLLLAQSEPGVGVVPRSCRGWEPLAALYPVEALASFEQSIEAGRLGLQEWLAAASAIGWIKAWEVPEEGKVWFRNANTAEDWHGIQNHGASN
ncbi:MAG: molybdenum cofactor guanylyltransferase [Blastochloris sp.]|nr:molybdenum cofactor guanylyltransferase [Blastochloris sp.]